VIDRDSDQTTVVPEVAGYTGGARAAVPFAFAVFLLGVAFGALARSIGWGALAPVVMSLVVFSGSAQFGAVSILAAGGGALAALLAAVLLNSRFLPMGVAIAPALRGGPIRRAVEGQASVDASWAIASRPGGRFDREALIGATLVQYPAWVGGTLVGAVGGGAIGDLERLGLDAIFPAFFLALLVEELRGRRAVAAALIGASLALVLIPLTPAGVPVLAASVAALIGLRRA
jgi:4-azaleucine resistance transporter AzlC